LSKETTQYNAETKPWTTNFQPLNLSLPESVMETFKVLLSFESVDVIKLCDYSNETSSAVLSHGTIIEKCFTK